MLELKRLYFNETKKESIAIYADREQHLSDFTSFDHIQIFYESESYTFIITSDCFHYSINTFIEYLKIALANELQLDSSITKSLGYLYSQHCQKNPRKGFKYLINDSGSKYWIGYEYMLFSSSSSLPSSWIYNDKTENIILEIAPTYPWSSCSPDEEEGEVFIKYSEWMKNYKTWLVKEIPRDTAQKWIEQLQELFQFAKDNYERIKCTGPGCEKCAQGKIKVGCC